MAVIISAVNRSNKNAVLQTATAELHTLFTAASMAILYQWPGGAVESGPSAQCSAVILVTSVRFRENNTTSRACMTMDPRMPQQVIDAFK